jgi:heme/copper-type cytochrome/quinol oxidase subunit 2
VLRPTPVTRSSSAHRPGNAGLEHHVLDLYETSYKIPTDEAGTTFDAQCAVLCGAKHADTRAEVGAVTPEECEIWVEEHREGNHGRR